MKLWRLPDSLSHDAVGNYDMYPVADFMSPFGARIMCLDASFEEEVYPVCFLINFRQYSFALAFIYSWFGKHYRIQNTLINFTTDASMLNCFIW